MFVDINDSVFLPGSYSQPGYVIGASKGTAIGKVLGPITLDGGLTDWSPADHIGQVTDASGTYDIYGRAAGDSYVFAIHAPVQIAAGTTAWLNTDRDATTGYKIFGTAGGEEFNVNFDARGYASLFTGGAGQTLVMSNIDTAFSADRTTVEFAVPKAVIGNPTAIDTLYDVNDTSFLPTSYASPPFTVYDTSLTRTDPTHRVGIVFSQTTANNYFSPTAYSQLFANAQSEAMAAGVTYDLLTESDLTNLSKLSNYDTLIFPSFRNVQASQVTAITNTLQQATQQFHIGLIAAGDFMTNDQTGAALPGDSYAREKLLFDATRVAGTFPVSVDLYSTDSSHLVLNNYNSGDLIHSYTNIGFNAITGVTNPGTALVSETINGTDHYTAALATQTGGRNVLFATEAVSADSHLLSQAIDYSVNGPGVSVGLELTRNKGILASRTDLDQSQELSDVKPDDGSPGIYAKLLPILAQWKADYNFVGSFYANIGNDPSKNQGTDWSVSGPFYKALIDMGSELGTHSYTHPEDTNILTPAQIEFEFNQSKLVFNTQMSAILGRPFNIDGAAVPGAPETLATSTAIAQYFNYVSGGYSGVGAGYPGAFGYLTPGQEAASKVYIAPNAVFDYTLVGFQHLTAAQAETAWATEWTSLTAHAKTPIVVWPWHDYGPTQWVLDPGVASPYTLQMYTDYIARAAAAGSEFVTLDDLAQRIASFDNSGVTSSVSGNVITATVASADSSHFALDVSGQGSSVIQNVAGWYAYDGQNVFLPKAGGTFTITLGAVADDVTHITALPMRSQLLSLTGDGSNLSFSVFGEGVVTIDLKNPATSFVAATGATIKSLAGDILTLDLGAIAQHDIVVKDVADAAPVITSNGGGDTAVASVFENATVVLTVTATDVNIVNGDTIHYSLAGGADAAQFAIDATTGALSFLTAPHFATPTDSTHTNNYQVTVAVTDSKGLTDTQALTVSVLPALDSPPVITSNGGGATAALAIDENTTAVTSVTATDPDPGTTLVYSIAGGADAALFAIDATTGALSFLTAPNFEAPADAGAHNIYNVIVRASDGTLAADQALAVTVRNVDEPATGSVNITSYSAAGGIVTLNATSTLADSDVASLTPSFQWQSSVDGTTWTNIAGKTTTTLVTNSALANQSLRLLETYTDPFGVKTVTSVETALVGTTSANTINGTPGNDLIFGLGGTDVLKGNNGDDVFLFGGTTTTFSAVDGGSGIDTIKALNDATVIGLSSIVGVENITADGHANVTIAGNFAANVFDFSAVTLTGIKSINTNGGNDTVIGSAGNDVIDGGPGNDTLSGGPGDDTFLIGLNSGTDTINGGPGNDLILATANGARIGLGSSFSLAANSVETISGGGFNDVHIIGTSGNDILDFTGINLVSIAQIDGGSGNDTITGSSGDDVIFGGAGNDTMYGGAGNDTFLIALNNGADTIYGGPGNDTILATASNVAINLGSSFSLAANSVETISAGGFAGVRIVGTNAPNNFDFSGITLNGIARIDGGVGADVITGSSGDDTIYGGGGADILRGGGGANTFVYLAVSESRGTTHDVLPDFNAAVDKISLPGVHDTYLPTITSGTLNSATFNTNLASVFNAGILTAGAAEFFTPTAGDLAGHTFLIVDGNGLPGYQANADWVFEIGGPPPASPGAVDFII